jgi:septal ring-binding cell division protein DamX
MRVIVILLGLLFCTPLYAVETNIPASEIQNSGLSVEQLQQAAEAGDPDAQYALGYLYYYGKNVSQNTQIGLNWIKRASVQGQEQALEAMRTLAPNTVPPKVVVQTTVSVTTKEMNKPTQTPPAVKSVQTSVVSENKEALNGSDYTIQLLITSNKAELNRYIQKHGLGSKATYYPTQKHGYVLVYGTYKTRAEAQAGLAKLPASIRAQKPWIKQLSQVKKNI